MLDKYIWGDVLRISPEAPVQVVNVQRETYAPGGAANVAANIAALSGQAYMIGIVGDDRASEREPEWRLDISATVYSYYPICFDPSPKTNRRSKRGMRPAMTIGKPYQGTG